MAGAKPVELREERTQDQRNKDKKRHHMRPNKTVPMLRKRGGGEGAAKAGSIRRDWSFSMSRGQNQPDAAAWPCAQGERLIRRAPHGHWQTTTMISSVRLDGTCACLTVEGASNTEVFRAYVSELLVPSLQPGDSKRPAEDSL